VGEADDAHVVTVVARGWAPGMAARITELALDCRDPAAVFGPVAEPDPGGNEFCLLRSRVAPLGG
jgi:hypothetical protein